jgi:hypothetical protein
MAAVVVLRVKIEREEQTACCFGAGSVSETESGYVLEWSRVQCAWTPSWWWSSEVVRMSGRMMYT